MKRIPGCIVEKGNANNITTNISVPDIISAPIEIGQKIGEVTYLINGEIIATTNIVAKENIEKLNFVNMCIKIIEGWFKLCR